MFVDSEAAPFCSHREHFARPGAFSTGPLRLFRPECGGVLRLKRAFRPTLGTPNPHFARADAIFRRRTLDLTETDS